MVALIPAYQKERVINQLKNKYKGYKINVYSFSNPLSYEGGLYLGKLYSDCDCIELFVYYDNKELIKMYSDLIKHKFTFVELKEEFINTYSNGEKDGTWLMICEDTSNESIAKKLVEVIEEHFENQNQQYDLVWALSLETDEPTIRTNNIISILKPKEDNELVTYIDTDTLNFEIDSKSLLQNALIQLINNYF